MTRNKPKVRLTPHAPVVPSGFGVSAPGNGKKLFLFSLLPTLEFPAPTLPTKNPNLFQDTILPGPDPDPQASIIR